MAINFKIGFTVDAKDLSSSLSSISKEINNAFSIKGGLNKELAEATQQAMVLEKALTRATSDKGVSNFTLNAELRKAGTSADQLVTKLAAGGDKFAASLNAANTALAMSNRHVVTLNDKIKETARVMTQSFKFTAAQTVIRTISKELQGAYYWVTDLNDAINDIAVVTGKTADQVTKVTEATIAGAKGLKVAARDYAEGALIFYQQGLNDEEVKKRNEINIKAAKAAGQSIKEMSSQLTAIWNTYNMAGEEQLRAASVGAKMAAQTAVDFKDIATAMQSAAAPAAQVGLEYNSLAAIIATVGDATQQSASVIGNAYKTILSRLQQLRAEGTDGEVTLGQVSAQLKALGVNVLDASGKMIPMENIILNIGSAWDTFSEEQKTAIAQIAGGTRQWGQFLALFNNFDKFLALRNEAMTENGETLEQQYTQALDSIQARAEIAGEAWKRAFSGFVDVDAVKTLLSVVEQLGEVFEGLVDGLGGVPGLLMVAAGIFAKQLVPASVNFAKNVAMGVRSMLPGGAAKKIDSDYNKERDALQQRRAQLSGDDTEGRRGIDAQLAKSATNREVAQINEKINAQLQTANGAYKIQLQYLKEQLANAQQRYQLAVDESAELDRQIEKQQRQLQLDDDRARRLVGDTKDKNGKELTDYQLTNRLQGQINRTSEDIVVAKAGVADARMAAAESQKTYRANPTKTNLQEATKAARELEAAEAKLLSLEQKRAQLQWAKQTIETRKMKNEVLDLSKAYNDMTRTGSKDTSELKAKAEQLLKTLSKKKNLDGEKLFSQEEIDNASELIKATQDTEASAKNLVEHMSELIDKTGEAVEEAKQLSDIYENADEASSARGKVSEQDPDNQEPPSAEEFKADVGGALTGVAEGVTQLTGGLTMALGAWSMLANTMSDDSATLGQKVVAAIGAISMGLPAINMVVTGIGSVGNALALLTPGIAASTAAFKTSQAAMMETAATSGILSKAFMKTMWASIKAAAGVVASWMAALAPFLPIIAAVTAVIATLALLGKAIYDNSPTGQLAAAKKELEASKKEAEAFKEALDGAKQEADELKSAFDKYDQVQSALEKCVKGTEKWKEAMQEANNQVLDMIREYPELAQYVEKSADGLLTISDDGRRAAQVAAQEKVSRFQGASFAANQNVRQDQLTVDRAQIIKDFSGGKNIASAGQVGTIIDEYLEDILTSTNLNDTVKDIMEKEYLQGTAEQWVAQLNDMIPSLKEFDAQITAAAKSKEIENGIIADSIIQNSDKLAGYQKSNAMQASGAVYDKVYKDAYKAALIKAQSRGIFNEGTTDSIESFKQYANGMQLKDWKVTNYKGNGQNASVEYEYYDEEGQKQTGEATAEMIARFNAAAEAGEKLEASLVALAKEADRLADSKDSGDQALSSFLGNGNLEKATQEQFNDIKGDVAAEGNARAYLEKQFGDLEEVAQNAGYADADAFVAAFEKTLQEIDWDSIPEGLREVGTLTLEQAKVIGETYTKVMNISGEQAANQYADGLKKALEGVDEDDINTVQSLFAGIDWTKDGALNDFANGMRDLGYEVDITDKQWSGLDSTMRKTFKVQPDLDALVASIKQANEIADKVELGSIISEEDYKTLVNYNAALAEYFTILADGSAKMIGDPLDFQQTMRETEQQKLRDAISSYKQQMQELEGVSGSQNYVNDNKENKYRTSNVNTQLDYIEANSGASAEQIAAWREDLADGQSTVGVIDAIGAAFDKLGISAESAGAHVQEAMTQLAMSADSMEERMEMFKNGDINELALAQASEAAINSERWEGLDVDEVENYAKHLQKAAVKSDMLADSLEGDEEAAEDVARATKKLNQGVNKLADGFEDWSSILEDSDAASEEYCEAMDGMKNAMSDVLDISEDFLSDDFILKNMDDIKLAAEGDADAIDRLRQAALEDIVMKFELTGDLTNEELWTKVQGLQDELNKMFPNGIEIGTSLDLNGVEEGESGFIQKLNDMILEAGLGAEQVNAMLSGMGFTANFASEPQEIQRTIPAKVGKHHYITNIEEDEKTGEVSYDTYEEDFEIEPARTETVTEDAYSMETSEPGTTVVPKINSLTKTGSGAMNNYSSSNRGGTTGKKSSKGGGGSKTPVKKVKRTQKEEKERYTDNKNAIEDLSTSIDRLSKATDRAFGPQKIRNINLANSLLAKQAKRYQILYKEAKNYQQLDAQDLTRGLEQFNAKWGSNLKAVFDGDFLMDNEMEIRNAIADIMNTYIEKINEVEDKINNLAKEGVANDDSRVTKLNEELEKLQDTVDELNTDSENLVKKKIESFQEAVNEANAAVDAIADLLREALENEIQKYTIARDLHLQINDLEQRHWRAIMDNMGEVGKLGKQTADMLSKSLESIGDSVDRYITHYNQMGDVQQRWANRDITLKVDFDISDEAWEQAMQDGQMPQSIMDAMQEDVDALMDLRQQVWDNLDEQWQNYIDSIQYYIDEYDRITDKLTSQMSISDHLLSVIETVGFNYKWGADEGAAQYKNMAAQMDAITVRAKAVKGELALVTNRRKEAEKEMNKLLAGRDYKTFADTANEAEMFEFNRIKAHYDEMSDLETQLNEERLALLDEAYQKASEYAQQWGEVIRHEMDENLGAIFDSMDEAMDVYNQKRDIDTFYMDEVDKTFELNKLQREINEAINDISNPEALERYNKLLAEIEAKKEAGVQMTEKDLEILRAQFDLEQARDAYQDARNAKNTMRLTRDASGNYAYVYSADEAKIEDTQAKIEEAEHNLYKLHRDAADEYAETWLQLQVDWENFIDSIDQARYKQDAEYREMVDQRMAWYSQQSDMLANEIIKHNGAIDRSFADTTLGVITNTQDMTIANETYKQHHTELKDRLIENYQDWIDKADETMREVGDAMSDLEQVVNEETDKMMAEIDDLNATTEKLNEDSQRYLNDLGNFIADWVNEVNSMYDEVIKKIDEVIEAHKRMLEELARQADNAIGEGDNAGFDPKKDYYGSALDLVKKIETGEATWDDVWEEYNNRGIKIEKYPSYVPKGAASQSEVYGILKDLQNGVITLQQAIDKSNKLQEEHRKDPNYTPMATGGLVKTPQIHSLAEEGPELVLNESDTQNILNAVRAIRGVVQGQLGAAELGIIAKAGGIAGIAQSVNMQSTPQTVDQNVHIEASFPGVNAAAEVELALNNLIVQAAHYNLNNK